MTAEFDAVLDAYCHGGATRTRTDLLWDLRDRDRTRLAHAAFIVANAGKYDERGMPTSRMTERVAAQRELLERIAPEVAAMEAEADVTDLVGWADAVRVARQSA